MARHGRALISIIFFETLLIIWLLSWVVGDYLNNQYVRSYVNTTVQADSWIIGTLALLGIVGSSAGLVLRRKRRAAKTLGMVSTHSRIPRPTLTITPTKTTSQPMISSKATTQPTVTSASSKPSSELHPAVAALKADLSEARLSLGLASVTTGQGLAGPASPITARFEDSKPSFATQTTVQHPPAISQTSQPITTNPNPQPMPARPTPPTVIRPMAPPAPSRPAGTGQPMPLLKVESGTPPTPRPVGLLPRPQTPPTTARDVSTVITGIMPDQQQQQKKKESESSTGKTGSQQ
jgi:hypothetical protein